MMMYALQFGPTLSIFKNISTLPAQQISEKF